MYAKGLGINPGVVEVIQNILREKLTFEISSLLENLTDSNLTPVNELSVKSGGYTLSSSVVSI